MTLFVLQVFRRRRFLSFLRFFSVAENKRRNVMQDDSGTSLYQVLVFDEIRLHSMPIEDLEEGLIQWIFCCWT